MTRALAVALAIVGIAAVGGAAHADPVTLDFIESFYGDWHWRLDDTQLTGSQQEDVLDLRNRLNVRLRTGAWSFGLRLDTALFADPPSAQYGNDIRPEELFATWQDPHWVLTLGDDYLTITRGIALSLRKFDEVGFATNLRGMHAQYRGDGFRFRLGAGFTNTVNVDLVEEKLEPDPLDFVALARVEGDLSHDVRVGAHVVDIERRHSDFRNALTGPLFADSDDDPLSGRRYVRSVIGGASIEANRLFDAVDVFGELDYLANDETREALAGDVPAGQPGYAAYVSANGGFGPWTLLLEGKDYSHFDVHSTLHPDTFDQQGITQTFPYIAPPTLERIDQRVINNTDVGGVHLRVDRALPITASGIRQSLFASAAFFVDAPTEHDWTFHGYAGYERSAPGGRRLLIQAGLRQEEAPPSQNLIRLRMIHFDLDWFETPTPGLDVQLHWTHELRNVDIGAEALHQLYNEGTMYLSLNLPPHWSFTGQIEYLTDDTTTNTTFPGTFIQYRFDSDSFIRLFVGRSKGGLKCSGGICRIFPNFDGVKIEATLRF